MTQVNVSTEQLWMGAAALRETVKKMDGRAGSLDPRDPATSDQRKELVEVGTNLTAVANLLDTMADVSQMADSDMASVGAAEPHVLLIFDGEELDTVYGPFYGREQASAFADALELEGDSRIECTAPLTTPEAS